MAILAYGINHLTAPVELRERISMPEEVLPQFLRGIRAAVPSLSEVAILSTCNRTELYCALDPQDENRVHSWLAESRPVTLDELASAGYRHWDQDAARHLIRVASGLDSQVLGEPQILGQVKTAYDIARAEGHLGPALNLLSQVTLQTAKRVRTDTDIGRNPVSVASTAVLLARQIFSELASKTVLLVGAGETISLVADHLLAQGVTQLAVANRTLGNAEVLASHIRGEAMQLSDIPSRLAAFDIVISSTGSTLPIIGKGAVEAAIRQRRRRPIFMVDLAVPRDIEPEVGELPDVYLYSVDDLSAIVEENTRARSEAARAAQDLVEEGARQYLRELRAHEGQSLLRQFRERANAIAGLELERARQELARGASAEEVLDQLTRSLTNKLIHQPTVAIRNATAEGHHDLLDYLKSLYEL
ncbi:MAG: glutamyl-tRNA reductase [Pseudomonadales bacterium]|nr:glutamyl-tRNA reductase [Pseudomonadales bacterium]